MTSILKRRVTSGTFDQTFACGVGWAMLSTITTLVLMALRLSILSQVWSIVLGVSVLAGWAVFAWTGTTSRPAPTVRRRR